MTEMFNNRSKPNTISNSQAPPTTYQQNPTPFATRAAAIITNWEAEGHPSQKVAESIADIYDPNTQKANRAAIYMVLQNTFTQDTNPQDPKHKLESPTSHKPTKSPKLGMFMVVPIIPDKTPLKLPPKQDMPLQSKRTHPPTCNHLPTALPKLYEFL